MRPPAAAELPQRIIEGESGASALAGRVFRSNCWLKILYTKSSFLDLKKFSQFIATD
jgi:hypothetical protein